MSTSPPRPDRVRIFDTTLRDGEQSPGCSLRPDQKRVMARALAELGVDAIETGFPASSAADAEATRLIASDLRQTTLCALARCTPGDIEAAARALEGAERPRIHVFISTSPLHRAHKLGLDREQVLERAIEGVRLARRYVDDVEFSAEDALRTEEDFLVQAFGAAIAEGARTINVPDTVGYTTPAEIRGLFERLIAATPGAGRAVFSAHCHDDLGLAVANSLAAIEGGARQVECTINGIGERAGNAALEEIAMALKVRGAWYGVDTAIRSGGLLAASRLLSRMTGMNVQRNKAVVGANAFAHEAGIHQDGMLKHRDTYEIMRPEDIGWPASQLVLGRHSGRHAVLDRLRTLGYALDEAAFERVFQAFKARCEVERVVRDHELAALVDGGGDAGAWRLGALAVSDGGRRARAHVELRDPDGRIVTEVAEAEGPVAALFEAMTRATGVEATLESYQVHATGTGADARGEANLSLRVDGDEHAGLGSSHDVIEASALAWLDVANRVLRQRAATPPRTLYDKLWDAHVVVPESPEAPAVFFIDLHLLHEVTSPQAFAELERRGLRPRRPDLAKATLDHSTPTLPAGPDGRLPWASAASEAQVERLRGNCARHGIELFDLGARERGIVHVIAPELGLTRPGMSIVCGDSHTSTHGAFGALAFGIGSSEVGHVLATQCLAQRKARQLAITIDGALAPGVSAKDVVLHAIGVIGVNGGTGHVIEFRGSTIRAMDMEARMTVCNMAIEAGARAGLIAPDQVTFDWLARTPRAPRGAAFAEACAGWAKLATDDGAAFDREVRIDAAAIRPTVTWGTHPGASVAVDAAIPVAADDADRQAQAYMGLHGGEAIAGTPIDVVFVGSCTNGRLADLRAVAGVLAGRRVHPRVRMLVVPGSMQVKREAEAEGLHHAILAAGAEWREPGCSMCIAMNGDLLAPGQRAVSTSNRNFEGRQGPGARTILASPATAAASAVAGAVADPRAYPPLRAHAPDGAARADAGADARAIAAEVA